MAELNRWGWQKRVRYAIWRATRHLRTNELPEFLARRDGTQWGGGGNRG